MGHDISGYNNKGEEIAYARYSMSNYNASLLYEAFDSSEFHAGVSGTGDKKEFTLEEVENAKAFFEKLQDKDFQDDEAYEKKKLCDFINNCLAVAIEEGTIQIFFG